ncbi:MAG: triple tyrosine motif-containing protein [Bacteroidota bacterium]
MTQDSFLYLGGINGITEIDLRYTEANTPFGKSDLPVVKNAYTVYNDKNEINTFTDFKEGIVLNYGDTYFELDFSIIDFSGEPTFDFAYRIEGLNKDWIYKKDGKLQLSKPKFGEYELRIKAKGIDGRWSENELSIPIISNKPLFLSTWFLIFAGLMLGILIYLIVKWRSRYLEQENLRLEQEINKRTITINAQLTALQKMQAHKQRIYAIIGHDLRSPITGMLHFSKKINFLIQRNRMQQLQSLGQQFEQNLENIYTLLNNLLDWSRLEGNNYHLNIEKVNLSNIIGENIALYEVYIKKKKLLLSKELPNGIFVLADKRSLTTIIRNLLDNAVKYSIPEGQISLKVVSNETMAIFSISNIYEELSGDVVDLINKVSYNGQVQETESLGLQICKELVKRNEAAMEAKIVGQVLEIQIKLKSA